MSAAGKASKGTFGDELRKRRAKVLAAKAVKDKRNEWLRHNLADEEKDLVKELEEYLTAPSMREELLEEAETNASGTYKEHCDIDLEFARRFDWEMRANLRKSIESNVEKAYDNSLKVKIVDLFYKEHGRYATHEESVAIVEFSWREQCGGSAPVAVKTEPIEVSADEDEAGGGGAAD